MSMSEDILQWFLIAICLAVAIVALVVSTLAYRLRGEVHGLERYVTLLEQMTTSLLITHSQFDSNNRRNTSDREHARSR